MLSLLLMQFVQYFICLQTVFLYFPFCSSSPSACFVDSFFHFPLLCVFLPSCLLPRAPIFFFHVYFFVCLSPRLLSHFLPLYCLSFSLLPLHSLPCLFIPLLLFLNSLFYLPYCPCPLPSPPKYFSLSSLSSSLSLSLSLSLALSLALSLSLFLSPCPIHSSNTNPVPTISECLGIPKIWIIDILRVILYWSVCFRYCYQSRYRYRS